MVITPDDILICPITAMAQCRGVVLCAATTDCGENSSDSPVVLTAFSKEPWSSAATVYPSPLHTVEAMGVEVWPVKDQ